MLHHISLSVSDLERSAALYDAALGALGYVRVWSADGAIGYGPPGGGDKFALKIAAGSAIAPGSGFHVAFAAGSREAVDAFHAAAVTNGATDDGQPGLRPHYGPHYYAAFVLDPDGHKIEAVINDPV